MEFPERLKELRFEAKLTQVEVSKYLNIRQSAYVNYEKGANMPLASNLKKLSQLFNVSISYLLGETDVRSGTEINNIMEKLSQPRQKETLDFAKEKLIEQERENNVIPLHRLLVPYEVEEEQALSAGLGEGYTDYSNKEILYWDKEVSYDRAIRIKGESMEPDFHYGEIALIKYQDSIDYPGQVCAVDDTERGKAYIKRVFVIDNGLWLESINDLEDENGNRLFPDIFLPFEDNPRIIGVVKEHFFPIEKT